MFQLEMLNDHLQNRCITWKSPYTFYGEAMSIKTNNRHCALVCNMLTFYLSFSQYCVFHARKHHLHLLNWTNATHMAICRKPPISEFLMFKFTWHINVVDIVYPEKFTLFPCFYCYVAVFMQCMLYVFVSCTLWQTDIATKITFFHKVKLGHKSNCQMLFWNTTMYHLMCTPNNKPSL